MSNDINEEKKELKGSDVNQTLFADYMLEWLETVKPSTELITYISYTNAVKIRIAPYKSGERRAGMVRSQ